MDSILTSIKKLLNIDEECTDFDTDLIIYINSAFSTLGQLGSGFETNFSISDDTINWSDYISNNDDVLSHVKTYIYLKVRMLFDPPMSSLVADAINRNISELEWRLNVSNDDE